MNEVVKEQSQIIFLNGLKLLQAGQTEEADVLLAQAHQLNPENVDALNLLGIRCYQSQDYKHALHFLGKANHLAPNCAETLCNLGLAHHAILEFTEALEFFTAALRIRPNIPEIYNNLGNTFRSLKKYNQATDAYQKAISLRPHYAEALSNFGTILLDQGEIEKAIPLFQKAISANPQFATAFNNLGNAFSQLEQSESAFECFEMAIQLQPSYLEAFLNFGNALKKNKQYSAAIHCYDHALKIAPANSEIFFLLGELYYEMGESRLAKTYYGKCLSLNPSDLTAQYALLIAQIPKAYNTLEEVHLSRDAFTKQLASMHLSHQTEHSLEKDVASFSRHPFYLAYQAQNNEPLLSEYGAICVKQAESIQLEVDSKLKQAVPREKIRVGIISNYLSNHPVWHAITKGWVHQLNPNIFEIYLFNTNGAEDDETRVAKSRAYQYLNCGKVILPAAEIISKTNLDVLIYPEIGMDNTCKGLACLRLAPLQIASWGHPETTGLSTIDFFLSGDLLEPNNAEDFYSEKLICLPDLGTYLERQSIQASRPNLEGLGIDKNLPILICAGSPSKYMPANDAVYTEIAKKIGACQFIFFDFDENLTSIMRVRLYDVFSKEKLDPTNYIRFIPFLRKEEFYGLMQEADLYLDTIDFSGFNTAMQAILCDLPIVTIEGSWMRGRLASAILRKLNLGDFVCANHNAYISMATKLMQDNELRSSYKARLLKHKDALFEDKAPIRALESFLIQKTAH